MMGAELWALQTGREDVRRRLQRKIWALQRGPRPHCVLGITKYPSVNLFTAPLALTVSLPPVIHYSSCWIERWERKKLHLAHVKRAALQKNIHLSKTLLFFSENFRFLMGLFIYLFILQFYRCKCACIGLFVYLTVCISLQERAHFESIGHHLGKLGEEGKIGHRVIDLTRPEDLDGKSTRVRLIPVYLFCLFCFKLWKQEGGGVLMADKCRYS